MTSQCPEPDDYLQYRAEEEYEDQNHFDEIEEMRRLDELYGEDIEFTYEYPSEDELIAMYIESYQRS